MVAASALQGVGCGDESDEPVASLPKCEPGTVRTQAPMGRATVLACGETPGGQKVEIWASADDAGPCIVIVGLPDGPRACGRAPSERVPPSEKAIGGAAFVQRTQGGRLELYGETGPEVRRVMLHSQHGKDSARQRAATLLQASDRRALQAAHIREPFGYFVGSVPSSAHDVVAEALDNTGAARGRVHFDPVIESMHPTAFLLSDPR